MTCPTCQGACYIERLRPILCPACAASGEDGATIPTDPRVIAARARVRIAALLSTAGGLSPASAIPFERHAGRLAEGLTDFLIKEGLPSIEVRAAAMRALSSYLLADPSEAWPFYRAHSPSMDAQTRAHLAGNLIAVTRYQGAAFVGEVARA